MGKLKLNGSEQYESINVRLSKDKTPIAFENKVQELLEQGAFDSREEAEKWVSETDFEMEMYYQKDCGLFLVEADAVENDADIYSPYTREKYESFDDGIN